MEQERLSFRDSEPLGDSQADISGSFDASGSMPLPDDSPLFDEDLSPAIGWPIWLAWVFGLPGFFLAALAWIFMGLAWLTPLTVTQTVLTLALFAPVIGGAFSLPGVVCALLATRRARQVQRGVAAPVTLVGLATVILLAGLLFGGLVAYPRQVLGDFGQTIQVHCARVAQSLEQYGNPPSGNALAQDPLGVVATLQNDQTALPGDQAALNALTAPDPRYQPLLDDCRNLAVKDKQVTGTLLGELVSLPPDVSSAQKTMTQYQSDTSAWLAEIQRLGAALRQQVFAPFQPG